MKPLRRNPVVRALTLPMLLAMPTIEGLHIPSQADAAQQHTGLY